MPVEPPVQDQQPIETDAQTTDALPKNPLIIIRFSMIGLSFDVQIRSCSATDVAWHSFFTSPDTPATKKAI